MRYFVLSALWIITVFITHLQYRNLLSGDPGMIGEYIGSVVIGPILLPSIVSGVICAFRKKTRNFASFIRGCCWVLGVIILTSFTQP